MSPRRFGLAVWALCGLLLAGLPAAAQPSSSPLAPFSSSLMALPPAADLNVGGAIYVPAYSSLLISGGRLQANFSVTLSVHNTSQTKPLVVRQIGYYDTSGSLVQSYLDRPVALRPFGTVEVAVRVTDPRGGSGANFLVEWSGSAPIAEPLAETLMMGQIGTASYSFVSQGRAIRTVGAASNP